jgi:hypothetical protein
MPVEKHAELIEEKGTPLLELRNICLMVILFFYSNQSFLLVLRE